MTTSPWLYCAAPNPRARLRLVCFPHAGGSASFFREWGEHLPDFEVLAVRYPGRAERIDEASPTDIGQLGADIADALVGVVDRRPLVLFGHSLGAVVALEAARSLRTSGIGVAHLIASGSRNADPVVAEDPMSGDETDEALAEHLVRLGGTSAEMAADPLFLELVLPYVRSDGRMFRAYDFRREPVLECPVTAIVGDVDPDADCRPWTELTRAAFREVTVAGDHFYLVAEPPYGLVRECAGIAASGAEP
jgi:surfactin synthase thioesterase subunit